MDTFNVMPIQAEDWVLRKDSAEAVGALRAGEKASDPRRLEDTAKQFEGLLIQQILKQMKETTAQLEPEEDEESSEEVSSEHLKSMFWSFLGDAVTEQGGFGLWEKIHQQMISWTDAGKPAGLLELDDRI